MTEQQQPNYVGWRGELLARLAFSRLSNWIVVLNPQIKLRSGEFVEYDFSVTTEDAFNFLVELKVFSSLKQKIRDVDSISQLRWQLDERVVLRARSTARSIHSPVLLFLFDADTGHGRYLRLDMDTDGLPMHSGSGLITVRLPLENTISAESLMRLAGELRSGSRKVRKDGS